LGRPRPVGRGTIFFKGPDLHLDEGDCVVAPFEVVLKDSTLKENWFRRLIAAIIDGILLGIVFAILAIIAFASWFVTGGFAGRWDYVSNVGRWVGFGALGLLFWLIWILYFAVTESMWGASIGKSLLGMRVVGADGNKPLFVNALIRNASRIHGLIFLLDFILGLVLEGDPRQRFLDRIAKTVVYQAKGGRGGPFAQPKILGPGEATAAAAAPVAAAPAAPVPVAPAAPPAPGAAAAPAKCPSCGTEAKAGDAFCAKCGAKLT